MDIAPLFDFQVNGFAGVDFQSAELTAADLHHAVEQLIEHKTGKIFLTLITDSIPALERKLKQIEVIRAADPLVAEVVCGYHLEGPYMSAEPGYCGAHQPRYMRDPQWDEFQRLQDAANGHIRLLTLAPERKGSCAFIDQLRQVGVKVALGHTAASMDAINNAVAAGAELVTHLGNGVPGMLPRHDNIIQRLLAPEKLIICVIPDGIHLPSFVLRNFCRSKNSDKVFFTTDCMAAAGAPAGQYRLLNLTLQVGEDGVVRMPGGEGFAGSSLTMDRAVLNIAHWLDFPMAEAQDRCSRLPRNFFDI